MTEYQNYKVGTKLHPSGQQRRPGSVTASSRLLRPTHASKNKQRGEQNDSEDEYASENGSEDLDEATRIKTEIEKIEDKIQKLGGVQSCGWDTADHKDFLRVRTKHKDKVRTVAFLTEMRRAVPTADEEAIQSHIEAFQKV